MERRTQTMQVAVSDEDRAIIESAVQQGGFRSAEEVVHAALKNWAGEEESPEYIAYVRQALAEADADPTPPRPAEEVFAELRRKRQPVEAR